METIITRIYETLKETNNLMEFEEQVQLLMYDTFPELIGDVSILEISLGPGISTQFVSGITTGENYVAIDSSEVMLQQVKKEIGEPSDRGKLN